MCDATRPAMDADFRVLLGRQPQRLASGANHLASCPIGLQPAESESYRPQHDEPLARAGVQSQNMTSGRWGSLMRYGTDAGGRSRGKKALLARMLTASLLGRTIVSARLLRRDRLVGVPERLDLRLQLEVPTLYAPPAPGRKRRDRLIYRATHLTLSSPTSVAGPSYNLAAITRRGEAQSVACSRNVGVAPSPPRSTQSPQHSPIGLRQDRRERMRMAQLCAFVRVGEDDRLGFLERHREKLAPALPVVGAAALLPFPE